MLSIFSRQTTSDVTLPIENCQGKRFCKIFSDKTQQQDQYSFKELVKFSLWHPIDSEALHELIYMHCYLGSNFNLILITTK